MSTQPHTLTRASERLGKKWCFQEIYERFGSRYQFIVIGGGREEETAASQVTLRRAAMAENSTLPCTAP